MSRHGEGHQVRIRDSLPQRIQLVLPHHVLQIYGTSLGGYQRPVLIQRGPPVSLPLQRKGAAIQIELRVHFSSHTLFALKITYFFSLFFLNFSGRDYAEIRQAEGETGCCKCCNISCRVAEEHICEPSTLMETSV